MYIWFTNVYLQLGMNGNLYRGTAITKKMCNKMSALHPTDPETVSVHYHELLSERCNMHSHSKCIRFLECAELFQNSFGVWIQRSNEIDQRTLLHHSTVNERCIYCLSVCLCMLFICAKSDEKCKCEIADHAVLLQLEISIRCKHHMQCNGALLLYVFGSDFPVYEFVNYDSHLNAAQLHWKW